MISDEYFWSLYASAALQSGVSEGTAAKMADNLLIEYKKRFKKPWVSKIVDSVEGTAEKT